MDKESLTLLKFLASYGGLSRREAEKAVRSGVVAVDGKTVTRPEFRVLPEHRVCLNGKFVECAEHSQVYVMLNKPRGYTSSSADDHAEHLAVELIDLPNVRLFSAGRLDKESEGLLLFSNDGVWIDRLTHPRYGITKEYFVVLDHPLPPGAEARIKAGFSDDGGPLKALQFSRQKNGYCVVLNEGKKREIRRIARYFDCQVKTLCRVRQGEIYLGELPTGSFRHLTPEEVASVWGGSGNE